MGKLTPQELRELRESLESLKEFEPTACEMAFKLLDHIEATKPKICIVGNPGHDTNHLLEMFEGHDFIILEEPKELMRIECPIDEEDLKVDFAPAPKPKPKPKTFKKPYSKRGKPWDSMG